MKQTIQQAETVNSTNVNQVQDLVKMVIDRTKMGQFKFRVSNKWQDGTFSQGKVKDFFGALHEETKRCTYSFKIDEPSILFGSDNGPKPA
jgi:hypothetical protein